MSSSSSSSSASTVSTATASCTPFICKIGTKLEDLYKVLHIDRDCMLQLPGRDDLVPYNAKKYDFVNHLVHFTNDVVKETYVDTFVTVKYSETDYSVLSINLQSGKEIDWFIVCPKKPLVESKWDSFGRIADSDLGFSFTVGDVAQCLIVNLLSEKKKFSYFKYNKYLHEIVRVFPICVDTIDIQLYDNSNAQYQIKIGLDGRITSIGKFDQQQIITFYYSKPATREQPSKPATQEQPSKPTIQEQPSKPTTQEQPSKPETQEHPSKPTKLFYNIGQKVEVLDKKKWRIATVLNFTIYAERAIQVHYDGFSSIYDEWIDVLSNRIAPLGTKIKAGEAAVATYEEWQLAYGNPSKPSEQVPVIKTTEMKIESLTKELHEMLGIGKSDDDWYAELLEEIKNAKVKNVETLKFKITSFFCVEIANKMKERLSAAFENGITVLVNMSNHNDKYLQIVINNSKLVKI